MNRTNSSPVAILFDLDGTLIDSYRLPYDGVPEMLAGLASAGYPLGIVTGKGRRLWEMTEFVFAPGLFDVVIAEDDMERPKSASARLLAAAAALSIEPSGLAYIGGSPANLAAGRAAGMSVGAALWPSTDAADRERFLAETGDRSPEWSFEYPADVTREFAKWC